MNPVIINHELYAAPLHLFEDIADVPRFYQANGVNEIADHLEDGFNRLLLKSPTGTGKTLMAKLLAVSTRIRNVLGLSDSDKMRILFISNKHRLNRQAIETFSGIESIVLHVHSAFSEIPQHLVENGWDITIMDECHHEAMSSIQVLLDDLTTRPIIGLTADDSRSDGLLLKFERVVTAISEYDAARLGFTAKVGVNSIIDTGKTDKSKLTCDVLERYHHRMGNTIIFMRTEAEVKRVCRFLTRTLKVRAVALGKGTSEAELDHAIEALSSGQIRFIVNCQKLGEGVDAKNITDIFTARNFNSAQEKKQFIGRGIRPDSRCTVWELINPLVDSVVARDVVGLTCHERMIYVRHGQWHESLLSGEDMEWDLHNEQSALPLLSDEMPSADDDFARAEGQIAA